VKDLFSTQADAYKRYRPVYPEALYDYIVSFVENKDTALDVATGNGQAAVALGRYFKKVIGTDISAAQLVNAEQNEAVEYIECSAEQTFFSPHTFDLITVAQAYHWLQHEAFATEAARIARPGAVMAVWMYDRFTTGNNALNALMDDFYFNIVGPYWDSARNHVDAHYNDLPFPYEPLPTRPFFIEAVWNKEQLSGYLSSWSSVQKYIQVHNTSPLPLIQEPLNKVLGTESIAVQFPLYLRLGRIQPT
jgi:ubiquinone/menaquinone biosynthesis C-methylase UbiE